MFDREFDETPEFEEVPELDFFQDACASMARNACILLKAAGEPETCENVLLLIHSLPWTPDQVDNRSWNTDYFAKLLHRSAVRDSPLRADFHWYFVTVNTGLSISAHRMRLAAFSGILGGMDWESALRQPPEERLPPPVADYQRLLPVPIPADHGRGIIGRLAGLKKWLTRKKA